MCLSLIPSSYLLAFATSFGVLTLLLTVTLVVSTFRHAADLRALHENLMALSDRLARERDESTTNTMDDLVGGATYRNGAPSDIASAIKAHIEK